MTTPHPPKRGPDAAFASDSFPDGRLSAPAARRNRAAQAEALARIAPKHGTALELASGTGEHVVAFAGAMPGLTWQPSDPAPDRRVSIVAWTVFERVPNVLAPLDLDACQTGWACAHGPVDLVYCSNLLHLITEAEARICLAEMSRATRPGGRVAIYGPFLRAGQHAGEGDAAFDARIRAEDPRLGYKDRDWVLTGLQDAGLHPEPPIEMPANNLLLWARKPGP